MTDKKLKIGKLAMVSTTYDTNPNWNSMAFEWSEKSSDPRFSDNDVSIDIERDDAIKMIDLLKSHFEIE